MSKTDDTLNYTVFLTDPILVAQLQSTVFYTGIPAGVIFLAPTDAAAKYSAPILRQYHGATGSPAFTSPCISSPWFEATSPAHFPIDVSSGEVDSGGFLGFFKSHHFFHWVGRFEWAPAAGADPITGTPATAMPQRRWVDGAEMPKMSTSFRGGEGSNASGATLWSRAASRTLDGFGYRFDNSNSFVSHSPTESGGAATRKLWERFYIRPMRYPNTAATIWFCGGTPNAGALCFLAIGPDGRVSLNNIGTVSGVLATSANALPLRTWAKLDLVWRYNDGTDNAQFNLFVNGSRVFQVNVPAASGGLGAVNTITGSSIHAGDSSGKFACLDYDDWIGADWPAGGGGLTSSEKDWNYGSHVVGVRPKGYASDNAASWAAADWRLLLNRPGGDSDGTGVSSTTAVARLSVTTDALQTVDKRIGAMGIAAFTVGLFSNRGTLSGQLGYRFAPSAAVMAACTQFGAKDWTDITANNVIMYRPAGVITPPTLSSLAAGGLELVHDKGNDAVSSTVQALHAAVEVIGIFGPEDLGANTTAAAAGSTVSPPTQPIGKHNAQFLDTPWSNKGGLPPTAPVLIYSGTYAGNSTFQDLPFATTVQMLVIRVTDNSSAPIIWFPSQMSAHPSGNTGLQQDAIIQAIVDPDFVPGGAVNTQQTQVLLRIAGAGGSWNLAGKTYQYVAFCDPGIRFCNVGAADLINATADYVQALDIGTFNPDHVFIQGEQVGSSATPRVWAKGYGNAANANLTPLTGATFAGLKKGAGTLTFQAGLLATASLNDVPFIAFRRDDGSGDAGIPQVLQLSSYVGDGSGSRTINLAPASGVRPLWAMIVGSNGVTYFRDPSHTGTNSTHWPTTQDANGITGGGIDTISVAGSLNTAAVQFDVFVIMGSGTAGNGGWSINPAGALVPVDPVAPPGGAGTPWDVTPDNLDPAPVTTGGGVEPGGDATDFGDQCVAASTKVINQALTHIGVTKQIGDVTTEQSDEAVQARLHFSDDLTAVLRDFPWPFATRYAKLALLAGSQDDPVNGDWTYAYLAPVNMVFARRIVNPDGVKRAYDPNPVQFRTANIVVSGTSTYGDVVYTNAQSAADGAVDDPELEYTIRPGCAVSSGDALFRQMLSYKHAATLALSLARDQAKHDKMLAIYDLLKGRAVRAAGAESQADPDGDADWISARG